VDRRAQIGGFTLVELMVALALFALLITFAVPMYTDFLSNAQVRNAAEGMYNGVLEAQTAAVNANTQVQLVVTPGSGAGTGWVIQEVNPDNSVHAPILPAPYQTSSGAPQAVITPTPNGATEITFDPFGRIIPNPDASSTMSCIKVTNNLSASARNLNVVVSNTGQATGAKLCDPAAAPTEPQACPANPCS